MKITKVKLAIFGFATGLLAVPVLLSAHATDAVGEGQIEGGDIYRVRNLTDGGDFTDPAAADKCEKLQYKVRIHNPGPSPISDVHVNVNLPTGPSATNVSTVTVSADDAFPPSVSDTATVNISTPQKVIYTPGSSELLDANGNFIRTLPDVVNGAGVNIGDVGVSIAQKRYVQFKAEIDCPQPPPPSSGECKKLDLEILSLEERRVRATVTGQVNNAEIIGYRINFGDGTVVNEQSATHQYAQDGTYQVVGFVNIRFADGHTEMKTSPSCKKTIKFKEQPPEESKGICKDLKLELLNSKEREVRATVTGHVDNAEIVGYKIDFGDNTVVEEQTAIHKYAADGTYTVTGFVTIRFADESEETKTSPACKNKITFEKDKPPVVTPPPTQPPVPGPPGAPGVPGAPGAAGVSSVSALPATGPADVAAIFGLVSVAASLAYSVAMRRLGEG